ncbi:MAG: hypothetical protein DMG14_09995 [Acidobacteria bacterium]|nr:MAG: hypothetical protein DMG14_09995 [Acidobacteriota bacterium]
MRIAVVLISALVLIVPSFLAADTLPGELSDETFWRLVSDFSEESGSFRFEYMSNELQFQYVIPRLKENRKPGGVYLGVGPEQNFTYIAALQPKMAFIVDIRRQNLVEHLVYKAIFEMSTDRADFLSRLFSRNAPAGLSDKTPVRLLFQTFRGSQPNPELYRRNLQALKDHLMKVHRFPLSGEDQSSIDYIYRVFYEAANAFSYSGASYGGFGAVSYGDLMTATDQTGQARSYLASEENFQIVRQLHKKNLIVPVVGDFAGPKALRKAGQYIKEHGSTVAAFYTSNVEQYLFQQDDDWRKFLASVSTFPLDASSTFIRSSHFAYGDAQPRAQFNRGRFVQLLSPIREVTKAFNERKITNYEDVIQMSK